MKATEKIGISKLLRYTFLLLSALVGLVLLLNLSGYLGITSEGPFLRGEIETNGLRETAKIPLPDQGEFRVYKAQETQVVLLDFATADAFFKLRHLAYLLFQNLTWALVVFVLYQMYCIFRNLDRRDIFPEENARRMRWIALAVLLYPFVGLEGSLLFRSIVSQLPGHQLSFYPVMVLTEEVLLGGLLSLIIYALAEVFRRGNHIQQEQDLTI